MAFVISSVWFLLARDKPHISRAPFEYIHVIDMILL